MHHQRKSFFGILAVLLVSLLAFGLVSQASAAKPDFVDLTQRASTVPDSGTVKLPTEAELQAAGGEILADYDWYVATNGDDANDGSQASPFKTIQKAINSSTAGQKIFVSNGIYNEKLVITHGLTITGQNKTSVVINTNSLMDYGIDADGNFTTYFSNFTLYGPGNGIGYGMKIAGDEAVTHINNVLVSNSKRSGIDLNGLASGTLTNVEVSGNSGAGIGLTDCSNIALENITTSGNTWSGIAIFTGYGVFTAGSDGISITGTNSFGETPALYTQIKNNVPVENLTAPDFEYMVFNQAEKPNYAFFAKDKTNAETIAGGFTTSPQSTAIRNIATATFDVQLGQSIQAAIDNAYPGDIINLAAGTYTEGPQIVVNKSVTISGAGADSTIIKPTQNTGGNGDARAWWLAPAGNTISISRVTLDGEGFNISNGIRSYATTTITDSHFKNISYPGYAGIGVVVYDANGTIKNNSFSGIGRIGVAVYGAQMTAGVIENNTFTGKGVGDWVEYGVQLEAGATATVQNNTFSNYKGIASSDGSNSAGILASSYFAPNGTNATITGNTITDSTNGVFLGFNNEDNTNASVSGNKISVDNAYIYASNPQSTSITIGENTLGNVVRLEGNPYALFTTIQAAVDAAEAGDTIHIAAGTYVENVVVNKSLILAGENKDTVIIYPAIAGISCASGSICAESSNVILIEASDVTIRGLTVDGDNPNITNDQDGANVNGANIEARNGIATNHTKSTAYTNIEVYDTIVKNIFLRGIYMSTNGEFDFHDNEVTNVAGESASIAIFASKAHGKITNNTVSLAKDGIAANWSKGIEIIGNTVSNSGSGIHTDNSNQHSSNFDLIKNNTVTCNGTGYGIFTFVHYQGPKVENNTVTGCAVGLSAWGSNTTDPAIFSGNTVDGTGADDSVGLFVTTSIISWGYRDIAVTANNNTFTNYKTAVEVTADDVEYGAAFEPKDAKVTLYQNNMDSTNTLAVDASSTNPVSVEASGNWWGTADGPAGRYTGPVRYCGHYDGSLPGANLIYDGAVTNTRSTETHCSIQEAVDAAQAGDALNISAGTFAEQVVIDKALTLQGPNADKFGFAEDRVDEAVVTYPDGLDATVTNQAVFLIESDNVTIKGLKVQTKEYMEASQNALILTASANNLKIENNIVLGS